MNEVSDFINGQQACKEGRPCPVGVSKDFERGYSAQYELEQVLEHNPKSGEKK